MPFDRLDSSSGAPAPLRTAFARHANPCAPPYDPARWNDGGDFVFMAAYQAFQGRHPRAVRLLLSRSEDDFPPGSWVGGY